MNLFPRTNPRGIMLVTQKRPRVLNWFHAGPLLFGDWGTSRLYVLGLSFYYSAHASPLYLLVMSCLMAGVAWAYTIVCRSFPEGGGVYTAARRLSRTLSVIGATLLLCDYIVTAALSVVEGFHYFGAPHHLAVLFSILTIAMLGVVNWLGARAAGRFALIIAVAALFASLAVAIVALPYVPKGLSMITTGHPSVTGVWDRWQTFIHIVLALSGVEAVANMTGLMKEPVARTARRTIWPVLLEVVLFNLIFGVALTGLPALVDTHQPDHVTYETIQGISSMDVPDDVKRYRDTAMNLLATEAATTMFGPAIGKVFGIATSIIFGLLLLSAVNTAIMAMVSVMYTMAQDRELPRILTRLNYSGVPYVGLILACAAPAVVLLVTGADVPALAELYAIGVCGAITINILCCTFNRQLAVSRLERAGLLLVGFVMLAVECTIIIGKPRATLFAGSLIALALVLRWFLVRRARRHPEPVPEPVAGWLAEIAREPDPDALDPRRPRIMLAARGRHQAEYAVDLARKRGAALFVIYVRTLRVMDIGPSAAPSIEQDRTAQVALGTVALIARQHGVPCIPIYVSAENIAEEILDYTVTFACDTLILGKSRRSLFSRRVTGDVVARVAAHLPDTVSLITRDPVPYALAGVETIDDADRPPEHHDGPPPTHTLDR